MFEMKLYCFCGGYMSWDQSALRAGHGMGRMEKCPTLMFLVVHPDGNLLFETGLDVAAIEDPVGHYGAIVETCDTQMEEGQDVVSHLASVGLSPDDIDFVAMSCLYYDHSGGLKHFPNSKIIVQREEVQEAWHPSLSRLGVQGDVYCKKDLEPIRNFSFIHPDGDEYDVFGDGRVILVRVPCHARGEQALLVRLPNTGSVLMPAGVLAQRFNFDEPDFRNGVLSGRIVVSADEAVRSSLRLRQLAKDENALVLVHHDMDAWRDYKQPPEYYD